MYELVKEIDSVRSTRRQRVIVATASTSALLTDSEASRNMVRVDSVDLAPFTTGAIEHDVNALRQVMNSAMRALRSARLGQKLLEDAVCEFGVPRTDRPRVLGVSESVKVASLRIKLTQSLLRSSHSTELRCST